MPGPKSKYEYLKPKVQEMLLAGLKPGEVAQQLPQIPRATVYRWAASYGAHAPESVLAQGKKSTPPPEPPARMPDSATTADGQLVNLRSHPDSDDPNYEQVFAAAATYLRSANPQGIDLETAPDFVLIQQQMRNLLLNSNNGILQIQAGRLLSSLIEMRATIPKHILYEENQSDIRDAMDNVDALSDEELAQQYKQMLG